MCHAYRGLRVPATSGAPSPPEHRPSPGHSDARIGRFRSNAPAVAVPSSQPRMRRRRDWSRAATARDAGDRPAGPLRAARSGRRARRPAGPPCSWRRPAPARRRSSRSRWPARLPGRIVVAEPRRVAARAAARRMAALLGEAVGGRVGYSVRGDSRRSAATRIEVVTTGLLVRRLQADPELRRGGRRRPRRVPRTAPGHRPRARLLSRRPGRAAPGPAAARHVGDRPGAAAGRAARRGRRPGPGRRGDRRAARGRRRLGPAATPVDRRTASGSTRGCSRTSPRPSAGRWPSGPATCWSSCPAPARSAPSPGG